MNHRYKQQLRRQQRHLASQLELLDRRRRTQQPRAASSNSLSSSGYSASELSESADSPDSGESASHGRAGREGQHSCCGTALSRDPAPGRLGNRFKVESFVGESRESRVLERAGGWIVGVGQNRMSARQGLGRVSVGLGSVGVQMPCDRRPAESESGSG